MPPVAQVVWIGIFVFLGAGIHGAAGFGFAISAAPFLLIVLAAGDLVPFLICTGLVLESLVLWQQRSAIAVRPVVPLAIGSFLGSLVGAFVLTAAGARLIQVMVILVTAPSAVAIALGLRRPVSGEAGASALVGGVSGILNATTGMSGPPVALFMANQGWDRARFRTALNLYFVMSDVVTLAVLAAFGLFRPGVVLTAVVAMPFLLAGYAFGSRAWRRLSDRQLTITIAAVVAVGDGLAIVSLLT